MKKPCLLLLLSILLILWSNARLHAGPRTLDIYFIDVEGGAATLIVTPMGQSLLIDTGFPGDRDAARIAHAALEIARLKQIDHCVITHWHRDHVGGVSALAKLIPIKNYYDHGLPQTIASDMQAELIEAYKQTTRGKSVTLKPGDEIKLQRSPKYLPPLEVRVLAAGGVVLGEQSSAPQVRPCGENFEPKPEDTTDNVNSVGILLTFGALQIL
jgi:competence protein ComEC